MSAPDGGDREGQLSLPRVRTAVTVLTLIAALLIVLSMASRYAAYRADVEAPDSERAAAWAAVMKLFDVNSETNLPTWFSSSLLLLAAAGVGLVAVSVRRAGGQDATRWAALSGILTVMSVDEAAALHERLGPPATALLGDTAAGGLHFSWVVPGAIIAGVVGGFLLRFLFRLPRVVGLHLLGAGGTFVLGSLVLESVSGVVLTIHGDRVAYLLVTAAEEGLEMGAAIWVLGTALYCLTSPVIGMCSRERAAEGATAPRSQPD